MPRCAALGTVSLWLIALLVVLPAPAGTRENVPFDRDWRFALQPSGAGFEQADFDDAAWSRLTLPHTWNAFDGQDGGGYVRGDGWYRKNFPFDPAWQGRRVFVQFDAANRTAEVFLNGRRLGEHVGGYARFRFDLTDHLRAGSNVLAVRVSNAPNNTLPLAADFTLDGGLYRSVALVIVDPLHVALNDHGSPGVFIDTPTIAPERATVRVRALIEGERASVAGSTLRVQLMDGSGQVIAATEQPLGAASDRGEEVLLTVENPKLWDGRATPHLYRARVAIIAQGRERDAVEDTFGIRAIRIDPATGFHLNGRRHDLHGVNYHQDMLDKGYAVSPADRRRDFDLMEEMGCTSIRFCHYQHADHAYQLCDERGLLAWAEFNFHFDVPTAAGMAECLANARQQFREFIRQNYNRPSIFCWSIGDETTEEQIAIAGPMLRDLNALAKAEDPTRPTTYASHHGDEDARNFIADTVGLNPYYGWYYGQPEDLGVRLDGFHQRYPQTALAVSEYGAGASVYQHEQNPPYRSRSQGKGPWHPEEWQSDIHERSWPTLAARPYLWANYIWLMFDFASERRDEGDHAGRNDKGLVTYDRMTRKDAFFWYKAHWTDAPLVYITSRRDSLRIVPETSVKVYSNCDSVELFVNNVSRGKVAPTGRLFRWDNLQLQEGANRIRVEAVRGAARVTDHCYWFYTPGKPYWPPADPPAG